MKKIIREEKCLMLMQQISQLEKDLISLKNLSDKKEEEIQNFMNTILKTNDRIIKQLKLFEEITTFHNDLHTQNIKKIKILESLINFSLGMNLGIVILLVFFKIKGVF